MAFFRERRRQEAMAAEEAAGASLWTETFGERVRIRIWQAFQMSFGIGSESAYRDPWYEICATLRAKILLDEGLALLTGEPTPSGDVYAYLMQGTDEEVGTVIEAMWATVLEILGREPYWLNPDQPFQRSVNDALYRERLAYEFIEGQLIPRASEELHSAIVSPTLRLLAGRHEWGATEIAYRKALEEIGDGSPDDAITDAGSALQEALSLVGCQGNSLGILIKSARSTGILAPHDPTLADGIAKVMDWVSADRSEKGDGHQGASGANRDDAWLIVHVVGALILRLASGPRVPPKS